MKTILMRYLNKEVGINIEKPFHFECATLVAVEADYFSVENKEKGNLHHFSFRSIVQIIENKEGVDVGGFLTHQHFPVLIKVGHIFEYIPA